MCKQYEAYCDPQLHVQLHFVNASSNMPDAIEWFESVYTRLREEHLVEHKQSYKLDEPLERQETSRATRAQRSGLSSVSKSASRESSCEYEYGYTECTQAERALEARRCNWQQGSGKGGARIGPRHPDVRPLEAALLSGSLDCWKVDSSGVREQVECVACNSRVDRAALVAPEKRH